MTGAAAQTAAQWPADEVRRVPIEQLIPYAQNARTHSPAQIDQLVASIKEWGFTVPVVIDEDGGIIAGHGRVLALKKLRASTVPCVTARGWSEAQKRAYILADNQLPLNAGWDENLLRLELRGIEALNFDIGKIGFDTEALAKLFDVPPAQEREQRESRGLGEAVIQFNIVFDDAGQQDAWFKLVRCLKQMYPNMETLGERLKAYVDENFPD